MKPPSLCADDREEEIDRVINAYADLVYRLAMSQEVFLRYVRKPRRFESEEHRKAWFIRVTVNCCKKFWSSAWQRKTVPLEENLPFEQPEDRGLFEALHALPPKYAAVLHLFYYEDLPVETIGRMLQIRPSTVRSQLTRGRNMLRERLNQQEESYSCNRKGELPYG